MTTYISILRGINVGGHKMIKMEALKKMCLGLGFSNIKTYIQSGNIIFQTKITEVNKINKNLKSAIENEFGFDVPVITLTETELENILNLNPFLNNKSKKESFFYITFLSENPTKQNIENLKLIDFKNDKYKLIDKAIYLYCPDSFSNTKLTNNFLENKLKVIATTRNWKTTIELLTLAKAI